MSETQKQEKKEKEKRPARYRSSCPKKLFERFTRGSIQPLYLINRELEEDRGSFTVLGSTGNVYEVVIAGIPTCTCPDFGKKQDLCKHLVFVLLKVVGLAQSDPLAFQKGLLQSEIKVILDKARNRQVGGIPLANDLVRKQYKSTGEGAETGSARRELDANSECPICFDPMVNVSTLTYCRVACGANFHKGCISQWCSQGNRQCPNCRAPWAESGKASSVTNEGFVNLGQLQGQPRQRDTSTYHSPDHYGYKRRRRYY